MGLSISKRIGITLFMVFSIVTDIAIIAALIGIYYSKRETFYEGLCNDFGEIIEQLVNFI